MQPIMHPSPSHATSPMYPSLPHQPQFLTPEQQQQQQQRAYPPNQPPLEGYVYTYPAMQQQQQQRYPSQQQQLYQPTTYQPPQPPQPPPSLQQNSRRPSQPLQQQPSPSQQQHVKQAERSKHRKSSSHMAATLARQQRQQQQQRDSYASTTTTTSIVKPMGEPHASPTTATVQRRKSSSSSSSSSHSTNTMATSTTTTTPTMLPVPQKRKEKRDSTSTTTHLLEKTAVALRIESNSSSSTHSQDQHAAAATTTTTTPTTPTTTSNSSSNHSNLDVNLTALMKQVEEKFMIAERNTIPSYRGRLYKLEIVQQPNRARMCGCGDKDRRPISPPSILKLTVMTPEGQVLSPDVFDPTFLVVFCDSRQEESGAVGSCESSLSTTAVDSSSSSLSTVGTAGSTATAKSLASNVSANATATAAVGRSAKRIDNIITFPTTRIDDDGIEREISQNLKNLVGNAFASAQKLYDPEGQLGIYFVFHDISLRAEGIYHLNFSLMHLGSPTSYTLNTSSTSHIITTIASNSFAVYTPKKFPGVAGKKDHEYMFCPLLCTHHTCVCITDSTELSKCFAKQGVKIPIRKEKSSESPSSNSPARKQPPHRQPSPPLADDDDYNSV
ncbi:velvet factor-domain-containing protein [Mycotypha africana]|uniref:velvet factor-domain-containing protein n=1 Tax=Mycotypha africana TaxID=64632 RepID=UPI00230073E2|nr:velvet factor-domain-containing protein [Mycotypha africana]KAI8977336.1 velvet factor-domain-containing protein [Mycotypha africana]